MIRVEERRNEKHRSKAQKIFFYEIIEENLINLKKEIVIKGRKAYRKPSRMDQKRKCPLHIIKTVNLQNKEYQNYKGKENK